MRLGLWQSLEAKVVRAFDVRQVLFFVEQGEAQAGIVYATDAAISEAVRPVLELEPDLSEPICYPLILMKSASREAGRLFEHLISPGSLRLLLLTTSVACSTWEMTPAGLFLFAAASTTDAVREIVNRFEAESQIPVRLNLAASSALAQQILAGAGADLFLSAKWSRRPRSSEAGGEQKLLLFS